MNKDLVKIQHQITEGIKSFEARKQELTTKVAEFSKLDIKDHTDKKGYQEVDKARKVLKADRVQIEKEGKLLRTPLREMTNLVSAKEKELIELTEPLEKSLAEKQKKYDDENEMIRLLEEKKKADRLQGMIDQLAAYNVRIVVSDLEGISDTDFAEALNAAKEEYEKAEAIKAEAERIENERIAKEKEEAEKQAKELQELREKQEAAERLQREKEAKEEAERQSKQKELINKRSATLSQLGLTYNGEEYFCKDVNVHNTEIMFKTEDEWNTLLSEIVPVIELRNKQEVELRQQEIEHAQIIAAEKERQRIADEQVKAELIKKQQAEREVEEILASNDKTKWLAYLKAVSELPTFEFRSGQYRGKYAHAKEMIENITNL